MNLPLLYHSTPESVFVLCLLVEKVGLDNKMKILLNRARLFHCPVIEHSSRPAPPHPHRPPFHRKTKTDQFSKNCDAMIPRQNSVKRNNERAVNLYIFRAYLGPSSGGTTDVRLKRKISTNYCIYTVHLLIMGLDMPEKCTGWRNMLRKCCISGWFFFIQLYRDERSAEHKILEIITNSM